MRGRRKRSRLVAEFVMPGLVPGIHVLQTCGKEDVDARIKSGHDGSVLWRAVKVT
jgi:hypothetical protein